VGFREAYNLLKVVILILR